MTIEKLPGSRRRQLHTIISRETIKPSFATPSHLRTYNLSPIDKLARHTYMPVIIFYPNNGNSSLSVHDKVQEMKKSLSQSLTRYYPFAGRLHTPTTPYVDCNDEGVVFVETKNQSQLETFQLYISEQDESVEQLFADDLCWDNSPRSTSLVGVQVNHFACGGIVVGLSMSHIIGDICTVTSFLSHWASVARYGSTYHKEVINKGYINRVMKKFLFTNTKLSDLKNKVNGLAPAASTRVEALTSLLYKTAVAAATIKSEDVAQRSYWCSSLCGFPFNKADFGWGKPMGVSFPIRSQERIGFLLSDAADGDGIEVQVNLEKEDMEIFENDKEMLSFCQIMQI
ncbi:hypothetical protein L2E82_31159 [Cichorium intybus]|uniref:Uncharacterized protein n=1 Tax=Cichorium intybus TaxID=13427 RepID=A0ACB9D2S1_CICIN|nr:hypothetical protein L2E82_31159 [Cichorium intybus]